MKLFSLLLFLSITTFVLNTNDYNLSEPSYSEDGSIFTGILTYIGTFNPSDYHYDWTRPNSSLLIPIQKLKIKITLECNKWIHFYVKNDEQERWENNYSISENFRKKIEECSKDSSKSLKEIGLTINENPFYIKLINPSTNDLIFTTEDTDFLYTDTFIGFAGYITSNDVFGFGERMHDLKLGDGKFTIWSNDTGGIQPDDGKGGKNGYGVHPLGFHKTNKNLFITHLFNNINAQDLFIETVEENKVLFEHRTIGGVIDYYITIAENPNEALVNLHTMLGTPIIPPFWSLGYHQCRWGYNNLNEIIEVYHGYKDNEIPIDTIWGDVDILDGKRIFTLNSNEFAGLPDLIYELHEGGYKFVPIVDIGFPKNTKDEYYNKGKELDCYIKSNYTNDDLISYVWPGDAVFPDFFLEESKTLWSYAMNKYYEIIKYDGIWLDMNEPAMISMSDGNRGEILPSFDPAKNFYEEIPYVPGYLEPNHNNIRSKTMSENAYSKTISQNKFMVSYNFKPLIPYLENKVTNEILISMNKRPFILSRSTLMGQNRQSFHWLGDNASNYDYMKNGVLGIFQFQIYGIPFVGDDICGFSNNAWDELCARWSILGAFFPFARNHNAIGNRHQDPGAWGPDSLTMKSARISINMRYSILRYYYTEIFKISLKESQSVFKPLFFEFYNDINTFNNIHESILIGNSLLFYPVYSDQENDINVYLPNDDWNEFPSGDNFMTKDENRTEGNQITLSGKFHKINLFLRGGYIIPYQETTKSFIPNTVNLNNKCTELIINPDSKIHMATGDIIFDDDGINTIEDKNYIHIKTFFETDTLYLTVENKMNTNYNLNNIYLSKLRFFRMEYLLNTGNYDLIKVTLNNKKVINIPVIINFNKIIVNLTKYKIRLDEINKITLFKNN